MHKILMVVEDYNAAQALRQQLGLTRVGVPDESDVDRRLVWVTYPGDSIMGFRTTTVIIARDLYLALMNLTESRDDRMRNQWWRESLLCRIPPGGKVIKI